MDLPVLIIIKSFIYQKDIIIIRCLFLKTDPQIYKDKIDGQTCKEK